MRLFNNLTTTTLVVVFSLLLQLDHNPVIGFPTGTGGCAGGTAAVSGSHLNTDNNRMVVGGTLLDGAIRVSIDGVELTPDSPQDFPINQDLTLTVDAGAAGAPYLGLLIRLEAPDGIDTTGALISGTNTQNTETCIDPIIGITHTNNDEKTTSTGTIRFDEEVDNVQLDVTVVFDNDDTRSAYAYSRLPINFRTNNAAVVPTESPVTIQFDNPVVTMLPTIAPITVSTPVAVSNVTANPTISPQVTVPVPVPTDPAPPLASSPSPTPLSGVEFDETKQPPYTGTDTSADGVGHVKTEKKGKKSKKSKSGKGQSPSKKKGSKKGKKSSKTSQ